VPDRQFGEVGTSKVAAQPPQQVHEVPRAVALVSRRSPAQRVQQAQQPLLRRPAVGAPLDQPLYERSENQQFLAPTHILLRRRVEQRLAQQVIWFANRQLVRDVLDQLLRDEFQNDRV